MTVSTLILLALLKKIENATELATKINSVRDGIIKYVADFEPTKVITDTDYDSKSSFKQWESQHPLALQSLSQFEFKSHKSPLSSSDRVLVKTEDSAFTGKWYMGTINAHNDDGTYTVVFDDGDEITGIDRSVIRKWEKNRNISVSDKVLFLHDEYEWCQGTVIEVLPHRSYKVHVHDGDGTITTVKKLHIIRQEEEPDETEEIFPVSPAPLQDMLKHAISATKSFEREVTFRSYEDIGDGCIVAAFWEQGKAVATWDGAHNVDLNLFTSGMKDEKHNLFHNVFIERIRQEKIDKLFALVALDQQPRGFGQVVSYKHDLKSFAPFNLQQ